MGGSERRRGACVKYFLWIVSGKQGVKGLKGQKGLKGHRII